MYKYWTSDGMRLRRVPPRHPIPLWNLHQATLNGEDRTNNTKEGWNNRFVHIVGLKHPSVWILISELQKEDRYVARGDIAKDDIGNPPQKRVRKESKNLQKRLYNLCQDRAQGRKSVCQFLRGVGYNIRWKAINREHQEGETV